jgi:hypothetical protein
MCSPQVAAITAALDTDGDGSLDNDEIKQLLSKMCGKPVFAIPDTHPDVVRSQRAAEPGPKPPSLDVQVQWAHNRGASQPTHPHLIPTLGCQELTEKLWTTADRLGYRDYE